MKVAVIADIHANFAALRAFHETYDELWVIGDLVNFDPKPGEVIDWVRTHGHLRLKRYSYPFEETIAAIEAMPIFQAVREQLSKLTTTGDLTVGGV